MSALLAWWRTRRVTRLEELLEHAVGRELRLRALAELEAGAGERRPREGELLRAVDGLAVRLHRIEQAIATIDARQRKTRRDGGR